MINTDQICLTSTNGAMKNDTSLTVCLDWLMACLDMRVKYYFELVEENPDFPKLRDTGISGGLQGWMEHKQMSVEERIVLLLAIAPLVRPEMLDIFFTDNANLNRRYSEFGGSQENNQIGSFVPTIQTALFVIAGGDVAARMLAIKIFRADHFLFKEQILELLERGLTGTFLNAPLQLTTSALYQLLWREEYHPDLRNDFPAKRVETTLSWENLVLSDGVMAQVMEIRSWMTHEKKIREEWGIDKILKPGYRALFHGPPGTGKTLTAGLLGDALGREVYRIDLSMVVSKFIGETEKNLAGVFDQAENENWVLFFDEADALFGKRTQTQSSNDRFANQEVSYLLQRVEDFPGVVILASNFKGNVDPAFMRRFQSMIYFPVPKAAQRLKLWKDAFGTKLSLAPEVDLSQVAESYEIAGGEIVNVVRTIAIAVASRGEETVRMGDINTAIRKEFQKDGRVVG